MRQTTVTAIAALSLALGACAVGPGRQIEAPRPAPPPPPIEVTPVQPAGSPLSASELSILRGALQSARTRDLAGARRQQAMLGDPVARKIVDWAIVDVFGEALGRYELERAAGQLEGWPRQDDRLRALERARGVQTPIGPIPYSELTSRSDAGGGRGFSALRSRMNEALRNGDAASAYQAISNHDLAPGSVEYAEAESFAGWLALNKLRDPLTADRHFARLQAAVKSPVSKARAAYWRGRAHEQRGDVAAARGFYEEGAQHTTTFYGQLAAERAGRTELVLEPDPIPTAEDRATFEASELTRALRLLSQAGERSLVRVFGLDMGAAVESPVQLALLVDTIRLLGEQEVSLLAYRRAAQQGVILHERGYPLVTPAMVPGGAEPALVLAIIRQESQFDPQVRSSADARGMMQILPSTAREVAGQMGIAWDDGMLWNREQNMRIGSRYLGQLVGQFGGSYVMAAAGYNAGPSRPRQWIGFCGDPRAPGADPIDFMECIPFNETRNYVMNVMSNVQMYRARLNEGRAPFTAAYDLRRGQPSR